MKGFSWKLAVVLAVIVAASIYVLPTFEPGIWPHKKINLGLDLQGGMHLVLEVDTEKALEGTVERISQELREALKRDRIRDVKVDRIERTKYESLQLNALSEENPRLGKAISWFLAFFLLILVVLVAGPFIPTISGFALPIVGLLFLIGGIGARRWAVIFSTLCRYSGPPNGAWPVTSWYSVQPRL